MAAVIALLGDFNGVVNSVCALSVTLSSSHLFSPLESNDEAAIAPKTIALC